MRLASIANSVLNARIVRLAVTLAVAPVLVLGSLCVETMLIHYDGHDIHTHAVASKDVDRWLKAAVHRHSGHDHDCQAHDPRDHGDEFFIVVDLPVAVAKGRTSGIASLILASATTIACPRRHTGRTGLPAMDTVETASIHGGTFDDAPYLCRTRSVSRILQANHALLL